VQRRDPKTGRFLPSTSRLSSVKSKSSKEKKERKAKISPQPRDPKTGRFVPRSTASKEDFREEAERARRAPENAGEGYWRGEAERLIHAIQAPDEEIGAEWEEDWYDVEDERGWWELFDEVYQETA
jgi:hypothetical protein